MSQQRSRAWRRQQRTRNIEKRMGRLPAPEDPSHKVLWQLHTPGGQPLPIFRREVVKDPDVTRKPFVVKMRVQWHRWGCDRRPDCDCPVGLVPSWPGSIEGYVWMPLKTYQVDPRSYPQGRLSKNRPNDPKRGRWWGWEKNWKLMYTRGAKIARQRQLGWLNYPQKPEDDFDSGEGEP